MDVYHLAGKVTDGKLFTVCGAMVSRMPVSHTWTHSTARADCSKCLGSANQTLFGKETNPKDAIAGNKVPLWLCSPIATAKWALAQFAGMIKYGAWNWRVAGVRSSVYLSAAKRHLDAYISGEELDPVDGTEHLANVMACCAILLDAKAAGKLTDDRPPSVNLRPTYAEIEAQMEKLRTQYADKDPRHYTIGDTQK